jgi:phosphohistidine phosphatase
MHLYLMRHGPASWPNWAEADDKRPLTPDGASLIQAEGRALAKLGLQPDVILYSPLVRARETATHIAAALNLLDHLRECQPLQPGFDFNRLRYVLNEYADRESLFLVGHMPDVADVTRALTKAEVKFSEGTIAHLKVSKPNESPKGTLLWLATAELLTALTQ